MNLSLVNGIDIFHGPTNETEVTVFVRCRLPGDLSGEIRGPFCGSARTLPTTHPLRPTEDEPGCRLASTRIVDPCYWTPSLPARYRAEMQVRSPDGSVEKFSSQLGIRRFAPFRRSLILDGRRIVVRGVHRESATTDRLDEWHAQPTCFVADNPSDAVCHEASELGVMTVARLDCEAADVTAELRRLSQHAAVAIAVIGADAADVAAAAPNMLLAAIHDPASPSPPPAWAHAVVCTAASLQRATEKELGRIRIPILAERRLHAATDIQSARRGCDVLQRDLAPRFDLAGYIV